MAYLLRCLYSLPLSISSSRLLPILRSELIGPVTAFRIQLHKQNRFVRSGSGHKQSQELCLPSKTQFGQADPSGSKSIGTNEVV